MRNKPQTSAEVAALAALSREELVRQWTTIYGAPPPKGVRQDLIARAIPWHLQTKRLGGLSAETRRLLRSAITRIEGEMLAQVHERSIAAGSRQGSDPEGVKGALSQSGSAGVASRSRQRRQVAPGVRLIREWNGSTHVVDVIEGGYEFEAKVYPSLTAIAGLITGAHSGPRFFGL